MKTIHWIQHVAFEGLGNIEFWCQDHDITLQCIALWKGDELPDPSEIEALIVMGGPMSVGDESEYPWLKEEKQFLKSVLKKSHVPVLGVCLGAQLIAHCLGAAVYPGPNKEIGWFSIHSYDEKQEWIPHGEVFHWHGDTFEIPEHAVMLCSSLAVAHQAFLFENRVLGLQFHLETNLESAKSIISHCRDELIDGDFIQTEEQILDEKNSWEGLRVKLDLVLDRIFL